MPPHWGEVAVPERSTLAGSVSVKASPDWAGLPDPLAMVKVRVEVWPVTMVAGLNPLVRVAGGMTVRFWLVTLLRRPPPRAPMLPLPLVQVPAVVLVTAAVMTQLAVPAANAPPVKLILCAFGLEVS